MSTDLKKDKKKKGLGGLRSGLRIHFGKKEKVVEPTLNALVGDQNLEVALSAVLGGGSANISPTLIEEIDTKAELKALNEEQKRHHIKVFGVGVFAKSDKTFLGAIEAAQKVFDAAREGIPAEMLVEVAAGGEKTLREALEGWTEKSRKELHEHQKKVSKGKDVEPPEPSEIRGMKMARCNTLLGNVVRIREAAEREIDQAITDVIDRIVQNNGDNAKQAAKSLLAAVGAGNANPAVEECVLDHLGEMLDLVDSADLDRAIKSIVEPRLASGDTAFLGKASDKLLEHEIRLRGTDQGTFLRGNSAASKITAQFCKGTQSGKQTQKAAMGGSHSRITSRKEVLEVDPNRLEGDPEIREKIAEAVVEHKQMLNQMLDEISSVELPEDWTNIAYTIFEGAQQNFDNDYATQMAGAHIFLRILCPYLMAPPAEDLKTKKPYDPAQQRTAILQTKLLQNLANGAPFKEAEMAPFNDLIGPPPSPEMLKLQKIVRGAVLQGTLAKVKQGDGRATTKLFNDIMHNNRARAHFRTYLASKYAEESLDFWVQAHGGVDRLTAQQLYDDFIGNETINIDNKRAYDDCNDLGNWDSQMFVNTANALYSMLLNGRFGPFRETPEFDSALNELRG